MIEEWRAPPTSRGAWCAVAEQVGMIGLGNMGGRISRRLAAAGFEVIGYDADPSRGGTASSSADVARRVEVVLLSLPDSTVVEPVVRELSATAAPGSVVVDLSTSSPASSVELHELLAAQGVEFLDAGISGGAAAAEAGTLTVMVGGSVGALDRVRPILACFAARIEHMGASGAGHTTKVLNNFLNGVGLAATAEALVAARKAGLDVRRVLDVINDSTGVNFATLNRFPRIVEGDYLEGGLTGDLMLKDLRLYVDLVERLGVRSLNAKGPVETFELAGELGYGKQISNRVVDAIGDASGGVRIQTEEA
jgi:3-hydroxyisobutyrate dehydrogenase-like beta-hydroxyacid dehydrogenase